MTQSPPPLVEWRRGFNVVVFASPQGMVIAAGWATGRQLQPLYFVYYEQFSSISYRGTLYVRLIRAKSIQHPAAAEHNNLSNEREAVGPPDDKRRCAMN